MIERPDACRVLGIDPGLNITGYATVDFAGADPRLVEAGALRTTSSASMASRVAQIYADVVELLEELQPDRVAIEKLYAHYAHPRTAIIMGHARGVILLACEQAGRRVQSLPATMIKKSLTGNGHASKQQIQRAVQSVMALAEVPEPPDVADAIAIALCAGRRL